MNKFPLSYAQRRLWLISQIEPDNPSYNMSFVVRFEGALEINNMHRALNTIVSRHEALRTTFILEDGDPYQVVSEELVVDFPVIDVSYLTEAERSDKIFQVIRDNVGGAFDLRHGPLIRFMLIRMGNDDHVFLVVMHHIISDEWSMGVFWRELSKLYEAFLGGDDSPLPPVEIQYSDYVLWQKERLQDERLKNQEKYWKERFSRDLPVLELATDRPRTAVRSYNGASLDLVLDIDLTEKLKALSMHNRVTLFMTYLAAFYVLLQRYTGQDDIMIGTPFAGRHGRKFSNVIGFFLNTLVLRTDLSGDPEFAGLLKRVRETVLGAYHNQDYPFERLVEMVNPTRITGRNPLFDVMFVVQDSPVKGLELLGLTLGEVTCEYEVAMFDLSLFAEKADSGLKLSLMYNTDLFKESTITRMMGHYGALLNQIAEHPEARLSELDIFPRSERRRVLDEFNDTSVEYPGGKCIHHLFEEQVERTPDSVAVVFGDKHLTYDELNTWANKLARHIQKLGVGPEVLVGIYMERSLEMIAGLIGVLKAGGAYVPLDISLPDKRLAFMLEDTGIRVVLTLKKLKESVPDDRPLIVCLDSDMEAIDKENGFNPVVGLNAANLAYGIYTSGSTGRPKGVLAEHRGLCNLIMAQLEAFNVESSSRVLQFASLSFDASVSEIFTALLRGAALVLGTKDSIQPGNPLIMLLREKAVTIITLPPSALAVLPPVELPELDTLIVAGEICPAGVADQWVSDRHFINAYGLSETTIGVAFLENNEVYQHQIIGRPFANMLVYMLDKNLNPVPIGALSELFAGGVGLARGYFNAPELTAEKFIPNPFSKKQGDRLYRTGDLARYTADGNIEFLGRMDRQVKVRGFRIELEEIETVLCQHTSVREAAVIVREDIKGDKRLVGYVVAEENKEPNVSDLYGYLKERLPEHMVPNIFMLLDSLPLKSGGKIDMEALPEPERARPALDRAFVTPRNPVEEVLVGIWSKVLSVDDVGIHDNFFELGGHSLLAIQVISRVHNVFNVEIPIQRFFEEPTVANMALLVIRSLAECGDKAVDKITRIGRSKAEGLLVNIHQLSNEDVSSLLNELLAEEEEDE